MLFMRVNAKDNFFVIISINFFSLFLNFVLKGCIMLMHCQRLLKIPTA